MTVLTEQARSRTGGAEYGSDVVVDALRELGVEYVSLNPGATFRGLHDSLVNYGGNRNPETILCTHEEIAVSVAHGYGRAAGRPMAAAVHNIVGLLHASMAVFNAWTDRAGLLLLGGTGPMDTQQRRPWIDWIHTALVQGEAVRNFVKWDDQPASVGAAVESLVRAHHLVTSEPKGPVYVCLDAGVQEQRLAEPYHLPDLGRYPAPSRLQADPEALGRAAEALVGAEHPVVLADYLGSSPEAVGALQQLAEQLSLPVIDVGDTFNFPTHHPLNVTFAETELLSQADVVLSLNVYDLQQSLTSLDRATRRATDLLPPTAQVIDVSLRQLTVKSWADDHGSLYPVSLPVAGDPALAVPALAEACRDKLHARPDRAAIRAERRGSIESVHRRVQEESQAAASRTSGETPVALPFLSRELWEAVRGNDWVLASGDLRGWERRLWDITRSHQRPAGRGGGGLGRQMGHALGVALAHRGTGRLCVNIQADGDLLFTPSALWTAAHHRIPLLVVIYNNRSYYNDEMHQETMARVRGRPVENKTVGIRIDDPPVDFAAMARSFGCHGEGPVESPAHLRPALERARRVVTEEGRCAVVDVVTQNR